MIKINLISEGGVDDQTTKLVLAAYIGSLCLCLLIAFISYSSIVSSVNDLTTERDSLKSDLDNLLIKTKAVRDLEDKKKLLREKLALLAKLKKSKIGPVRVLDDINAAVPAKIWLRELKESAGVLTIKGRAMSNQDIALLMQNLAASNYFSEVDLVESRQMYYSKRTGMVTPLADITNLQTENFKADTRSTKESPSSKSSTTVINSKSGQNRQSGQKGSANTSGKWKIKRSGDQFKSLRKAAIEEANIKIKEFVLSTKVHYEGKPLVDLANSNKDQGK